MGAGKVLKDATINKLAQRANDWTGGMFSGISDSFRFATEGIVTRGAGRNLRTGASAPVQTKKDMGLIDSVLEGHKGNPAAWDTVGGYSGRKIAGSYMAASAAGRIATGGGLYRDSSGETNIIGIPLI